MNAPFRVLAADDERLILEGYRILIEQAVAAPPGDLSRLEAALFGLGEAHPSPFLPTEVVCVPQAEAAVEQVRRGLAEGRPFALAFLDYHMPPGSTGIEAAKAIRALDDRIRIIIASGYTGADPAEMLREVPPADRISFLPKPFRSRELARLIEASHADWKACRDSSESGPPAG